MPDLITESSAPGVLHLIGEYTTLIGEPAVACALDLRLTIQCKQPEFDFFVVDGFKMDPQKHSIFNQAVKNYWKGTPLEFCTASQFPMLSGLGTRTALSGALSGLLMNLSKDSNKNTINKNEQPSQAYLAHQAFKLEKSVDPLVSPLGTATATIGRTVILKNTKNHALWGLKTRKTHWYIHQIDALVDVPIVIGFLKDKTTSKFITNQTKPLFDSAIKKPTKKHISKSKIVKIQQPSAESIPIKIKRMLDQRGFTKDVLKDMGKLTRECIEILPSGDLAKLGSLLNEQMNLIKILGVYPDNMRELIEAAKHSSYGVTLTGGNGDVLLALSEEPNAVAKDIEQQGGQTIITRVSKKGFNQN
jgi:mevalonate kinase